MGDVYISGTEHDRKLKFRMHAHLTPVNSIFEYSYASVILDNLDILCLEDEHVCRPVLKNETATMFFSKNLF